MAEFHSLKKGISVDTFVLCSCKVKQTELHGLYDSSIDAYCTSVYVGVAC